MHGEIERLINLTPGPRTRYLNKGYLKVYWINTRVAESYNETWSDIKEKNAEKENDKGGNTMKNWRDKN